MNQMTVFSQIRNNITKRRNMALAQYEIKQFGSKFKLVRPAKQCPAFGGFATTEANSAWRNRILLKRNAERLCSTRLFCVLHTLALSLASEFKGLFACNFFTPGAECENSWWGKLPLKQAMMALPWREGWIKSIQFPHEFFPGQNFLQACLTFVRIKNETAIPKTKHTPSFPPLPLQTCLPA